MKIDLSIVILGWKANFDISIHKRNDFRQNENGYVYLVQKQYKPSQYKIGQTTRLHRRLKSLVRTSQSSLNVICVAAVSDPVKTEFVLHRTFKDKNIEGEWFNLDKNDIALFENIVGLAGRIVSVPNSVITLRNSTKISSHRLSLSRRNMLEFFDHGVSIGFAREKMFGHCLPSGFLITKPSWKEMVMKLTDLEALYRSKRGYELAQEPSKARKTILALDDDSKTDRGRPLDLT